MGTATLIETVKEVAGRLGQTVPLNVFGNTDKHVLQWMSLLHQGLDDMAARGRWERLTYEYTFLTVATESQGVLETGLGSPVVAPNGFSWMLPFTLWDRTNMLPLVGSLDEQDWQAMKAWIITGPRYQFRLRGGQFLVNPAPTAGWTWAFEYCSENTILGEDGSTYAKRFASDEDTILLPDTIVAMDLQWRWKAAKGLTYAEDYASAERMITNALGKSGAKMPVRLDNTPADAGPTIYVPPMGWRLP